eukprot:29891-Pelagococcus_subviridis.AAC.2
MVAVPIAPSDRVHAISIAAIGPLAPPVDRLRVLVLGVMKLVTELLQSTETTAARQRRVRLLRVPEHRAHGGERDAVPWVRPEVGEDHARDGPVGLEGGMHLGSGRGGGGGARGVRTRRYFCTIFVRPKKPDQNFDEVKRVARRCFRSSSRARLPRHSDARNRTRTALAAGSSSPASTRAQSSRASRPKRRRRARAAVVVSPSPRARIIATWTNN